MQELAGRLTALDAEAIQTLKVISCFDALVANGAGLESLVRGAATVTGVAAGAQSSTRNIRIDAAGRRSPSDAEPDAWPSAATPGGGRVWIERAGEPYANDAMVLERLALSVAIVAGARGETFHASVEELIDASVSAAERVSAARRLGLDLESPIRVWATPPDVTVAGHSALVPTQHGLVRAVITSVACTDLGAEGAGSATADTPAVAPVAWRDAQLAWQLTDARHPLVHAEDLGAMIFLARSFDPLAPLHPDVRVFLDLDDHTRELLIELVQAESVRQAATALGLHHSSLQTRHRSLTRRLGYDPRSVAGRPRFEAARLLALLSRER